MIVKVQVTEAVRQVLIYNESRRWSGQFDLTDDVAELMAGRPKAFFYAKGPKRSGDPIELQEEAPWQPW